MRTAKQWGEIWEDDVLDFEDIVEGIQREALEAAIVEATNYAYNPKNGEYDLPACDCAKDIRALITKAKP